MAINKELQKLYSRKWKDFLTMQNLLNATGISNYSSPLLMCCWEHEYEEVNSGKKVLFIGQETNTWFECGSSLNADSLNQVI